MKTLCIVSCMHGREWLSELWARHIAELKKRIPKITCAVAVTTGEDDNLRHARSVGVAEFCDNQPLGAKHNFAQSIAPRAFAYMHLGSDDFVSAEWILGAVAMIQRGYDYVINERIGFYDVSTGRACYNVVRFAPGRVFSRYALGRVGKLWNDGSERYLDTESHFRLQRVEVRGVRCDSDYIPVVDVKTDQCMWTFDDQDGTECDPDEVLWMVCGKVRRSLEAVSSEARIVPPSR